MILSDGLIGKRISNIRKDQGLTQAELSEKVGISEKYLSRVERGRQMPSIVVVARICEALSISSDQLLALNQITALNDSIHNVIADFSIDEQRHILEIIKIIKKIKTNSDFNR